MFTCICSCVHMCAYACGSQRLTLGVFVNHLSSLVFQTLSLTEPELTDLARPAAQ